VWVPAAWGLVAAVTAGAVGEHPLLVAHGVMSVLLVSFLALSWSEMTEGALSTWRGVILVGTPPTVGGTVGLALNPRVTVLVWASLYAWLLLPPVGFVLTARDLPAARDLYLGAATLSGIGAVGYTLATLGVGPAGGQVAGLAVVGVGQTAGILDAVRR
jgi:hypothetical protein